MVVVGGGGMQSSRDRLRQSAVRVGIGDGLGTVMPYMQRSP